MGNKTSRRTSTSNSTNNKTSTTKQDGDGNDGLQTSSAAPGSNGTTTTSGRGQQEQVQVKVYRSTSTMDEVVQRHNTDKKQDIRLYRRSVAVQPQHSPSPTSRAISGRQTLPRGFVGPLASAGGPTMTSSRPEIGGTMRSAARTDTRLGGQSARSIVNRRSLSSLSALQVEFPPAEVVKSRLECFERLFVDRFTQLYSALPQTIQLSALSIAVDLGQPCPDQSQPSHAISLWQYLSNSNGPLTYSLPSDQFVLIITSEQLAAIQLVLRSGGVIEGGECRKDLLSVVHDIVAAITSEVASEIARMYEYQVALVGDGLPAQLVAEYAADRAMDFLKTTSRHLDFNSLLEGVVRSMGTDFESKSQSSVIDSPPATISVVIGQFELKWNIAEIFCKPGLRREHLLTSALPSLVGGYASPWSFYTSSHCDATVYGYRGQLLLRDYTTTNTSSTQQQHIFYYVAESEEKSFEFEVPWRPDDFHRTYRPYRRLVGSQVMAAFIEMSARSGNVKDLGQYVQQLQGESYSRDEVEPVFRPLRQLATCRTVLNGTAEFDRSAQQRWSVPYYRSSPPVSAADGNSPAVHQNSNQDKEHVEVLLSSSRRGFAVPRPPPVKPKPVYTSLRSSRLLPATPQTAPGVFDHAPSLHHTSPFTLPFSGSSTMSTPNVQDFQSTPNASTATLSSFLPQPPALPQPLVGSTSISRQSSPVVFTPKFLLPDCHSTPKVSSSPGGAGHHFFSSTSSPLAATAAPPTTTQDNDGESSPSTVRFPTIAELFSKEMKAIGASATSASPRIRDSSANVVCQQLSSNNNNVLDCNMNDKVSNDSLSGRNLAECTKEFTYLTQPPEQQQTTTFSDSRCCVAAESGDDVIATSKTMLVSNI